MTKIRTSKLRKIRTSKVRKIRTLKVVDQNIESTVVDQNIENQNIKKNIESQKSTKNTFDVLIIQKAVGNIRASKVLVHFLPKNLFEVLILPLASEKIRTSKVIKINFESLPIAYYLWIPRPVGGLVRIN